MKVEQYELDSTIELLNQFDNHEVGDLKYYEKIASDIHIAISTLDFKANEWEKAVAKTAAHAIEELVGLLIESRTIVLRDTEGNILETIGPERAQPIMEAALTEWITDRLNETIEAASQPPEDQQ